MKQADARALFEFLVNRPEGEIDVVRAALAIAAEEDNSLDVESWAHRIDGLALRGLADLPSTAAESDRLSRLYDLFFEELGFSGRNTNFEDPDSSFLHRVVDKRSGLPIALSVLFVRFGRRLGLSCAGVGFPGHFLAKVVTNDGEVFVDPFGQVRALTMADLARRAMKASGGKQRLDRWMLAAATPRETLARMLRNLKNVYARSGDHARAFSAVDRALVLQPDSIEDVRDRGLLCAQLGGADAARRDLSRYLLLSPGATDAKAVREIVQKVGASRTLLN
jgi:regulator of sirC expression with transglutaminase-like and TPR domain